MRQKEEAEGLVWLSDMTGILIQKRIRLLDNDDDNINLISEQVSYRL